MALDPTAREANYLDSLKKFFVDNVYTTSGIQLLFDPSLTTPDLIGHGNSKVDRWVTVAPGSFDLDHMSTGIITIFCCTRRDNEGFKLAQVRDTVMGYLTDEDATDGMKRITFYRSYADQAWESIGAILVQDVNESLHGRLDDQTKYKGLIVRLRFASKF